MSTDETPVQQPVLTVKQKVNALIYWENQKVSAAVVGVGLLWFFLISCVGYASSTVICYLALFQLTARLVYRNSCRVLADLNMIEKRPVPEAPETFVTEEEVMKHLKTITALVNSTLRTAYTLAVCDCTPFVLKCIAGIYVMALLSKLFGTTGLCFLAFAGVFSVPKFYQLKHKEVDQVLEQLSAKALVVKTQVTTQAGTVFRQVMDKASSLAPPKASDLKASTSKASNVKPKAL